MENKKKNLFEIAKENAKYKVCPGCGAKKLVDEFKKTNKYCNGCPTVAEIREKYKNIAGGFIDTPNDAIHLDIDDIDLDDFFKDL
jgi:hypothetical protein